MIRNIYILTLLLSMAYGECIATGCSSQICAEEPTDSTCEYLDWYACFQYSECGNYGREGNCRWLMTDLFLDCMNSFGVTVGCTDPEACNYDETETDDDGSCEYEYDCAGTCGGDLEFDCCGVCGGDNSSCDNCCGLPFNDDCTSDCYLDFNGECCLAVDTDCAGVCYGNTEMDNCGVCGGDGTSCETPGDLNGDGIFNVIDVVLLVNAVMDWTYNPLGDMNGDGVNNVVDVVLLVNLVLYGPPELE